MNKIPFIDLKKQFSHHEKEIRLAIDGVLAHGQFIMGPEIRELEHALADFANVKHVVSCSSGTDALLIPLMAYGIKPGDAVFTTPFTFIATAEVIALLGATPVFVDIDPVSFNIDPVQLERVISETTSAGKLTPRGIISVDLFGLPADYDAIMSVAAENDLFVLADAAQSFGSTYKGCPAGSLGHVAATSFFPAKPLGCYGDGGAVFTDDDELAGIFTSIRIHGKGRDKYDNMRVGLNARMDTLQAAILKSKLHAFPGELKARQQVAERYTALLEGVLETPSIPENMTSAWAQYSVLSNHRSEIQAMLGEAGVPTAIYYPKPLHLQTAFAELGYAPGDFPVSEQMADRIFSLPMHPYLEVEQIEFIASLVRQTVEKAA